MSIIINYKMKIKKRIFYFVFECICSNLDLISFNLSPWRLKSFKNKIPIKRAIAGNKNIINFNPKIIFVPGLGL